MSVATLVHDDVAPIVGGVKDTQWNESHRVTGGATGGLAVRDTADTTSGFAWIDAVAVGRLLASTGTGTLPAWQTNPSIAGITLSTPLAVTSGGTGLAVFAIGDMLYASGVGTLARRAAVADGNVLRSAGVGVAPLWGKVRLSGGVTDVTGTLPATNGGLGMAGYTAGDLPVAASPSTFTVVPAVAAGKFLKSAGVGAPPVYGDVDVQTLLGSNGAMMEIKSVMQEVLTADLAASITTTGLFDETHGILPLAVVARVTEEFDTANGLTGLSLGDGSDAVRWGSGVALVEGTLVHAETYAGTSPKYDAAALEVVVTAEGGTFGTLGKIRIEVFYLVFTPPTS